MFPAAKFLVAELGEIGFESFVETEDGLQAYILAEEFKEDLFYEIQIFSSSEFEHQFYFQRNRTGKLEQRMGKEFQSYSGGAKMFGSRTFSS